MRVNRLRVIKKESNQKKFVMEKDNELSRSNIVDNDNEKKDILSFNNRKRYALMPLMNDISNSKKDTGANNRQEDINEGKVNTIREINVFYGRYSLMCA